MSSEDIATVEAVESQRALLADETCQSPEEGYRRAKTLVLAGKPSTLARELIAELCQNHPDLEDCCAEGVVSVMWRDQLPPQVSPAPTLAFRSLAFLGVIHLVCTQFFDHFDPLPSP